MLAATTALLFAAVPVLRASHAEGGEPALPIEAVSPAALVRRALELPVRDATERDAVLAQIEALGPDAARGLVEELLLSDAEHGRGLALAALARLDARDVLAAVRAVGVDLTPPARATAIEILGTTGSADALEPALEHLDAIPPEALAARAVAEPVAHALARILGRDGRAVRALERRVGGLDPAALQIVARALGRAPSRPGLTACARLLGRARELDLVALAEVERIARTTWYDLDEAERSRLRELLYRPEPETQRLAAAALGALGDAGAARGLVDLARASDARLAGTAQRSLETITGLRLPPDRWRAWYEAELAWYDQEGRRLRGRLVAGDTAEVVRAAGRLSQRPLFRDETALELARLAVEGAPEVAQPACEALAQLGATGAVVDLIHALGREEPGVAAAAHAALQRLTGLALPPDPEAWRAELGE